MRDETGVGALQEGVECDTMVALQRFRAPFLDKLKRDLGEEFLEQMRARAARASPPGSSASHASSAPSASTAPPASAANKKRKHPHPRAFVPSPESPGHRPDDPRNDGHRSKRSIWF